ncbi:MAG: DoxX family protein [Pseudomonadota bacterium]
MTTLVDDRPQRPSLLESYHRVDGVYALMTLWLTPLALLVLRLPVAVVFWRSGRTKVEGWNPFALQPSQPFLFEHEFGMPFPLLTAHLTALAEHVLPVLLVLGLATRLSALGLLAMTAVIQLFVFPDAWLNAHMWWAATLFAVIVLGPGRLSMDAAIGGALQGRR